MDIVISDVSKETCRRLFSDISDSFVSATVTLSDGSRLGVSQYPNEFPMWGVDSYFGGNGFPHWVHSKGERVGLIVKAVNEETQDILNSAVRKELGSSIWE